METVTVEQAKNDLLRLLEKAAHGVPFVVAEEGKPRLRVVATEEPPQKLRRLGSLEGEFIVPDDFDTMGDKEIEEMAGVNG